MDADAARMLAKSLKAHKRKGATTSGSTKKARVEEIDSAVLRLDRLEPVLVVHLRLRVLLDPADELGILARSPRFPWRHGERRKRGGEETLEMEEGRRPEKQNPLRWTERRS